MGRVCREIHEWIEEQVERPVEEFIGQWQQTCEEQECNWWCLCCNKWLCWLTWVVARVVTWLVVTVGKWVTRIVCESVNVVLDSLGFIFALILSIPFIGGIIRTIWNWVMEIVWRLVGLIDFFASLAGIRPRKKMYFGAIVMHDGVGFVASDLEIMRQVNATIAFYDTACNIDMIFTGICHSTVTPPTSALDVSCTGSGFFDDWLLDGSYYEFATALCKFQDGFRRLIGLGAEIIVFVVRDIDPGVGCSFVSGSNLIFIEAEPGDQDFVIAHEIGHSCWLSHDESPGNLMNHSAPTASPLLDDLQISLIRWSRHCVYF